MANKYYTMRELQTMKVYELPNYIYEAIFEELKALFGCITRKMLKTLNNAKVFELDQYVNIYKYITVI